MNKLISDRFQVKSYWLLLISIPIMVLFFLCIFKYPGNIIWYVIFSISSNFLLFMGFRNNAIFFDTFIGVLFWLGFWLKLSFRMVFLEATFNDPTGNFSGSGPAFDYALKISSTGFIALILASFLREKFIFNYSRRNNINEENSLYYFYKNNRALILPVFVIIIIAISLSNIYFGFYQRGSIPRTILPYGLSGIYKWLLLFGLASFSALIINYELKMKKKAIFLVILIGMIESFLSSISLLSRAMIINSSALLYGYYRSLIVNNIKFNMRYCLKIAIIFLILFSISVFSVNYIRIKNVTKYGVNETKEYIKKENVAKTAESVNVLLIDRWVGIEGVLAISSYSEKGWDLWNKAWKETISYDKPSIYDADIALTNNVNPDFTKHHFLSLPGILAFWFYPGSFVFLFLGMFFLGLVASFTEKLVYYFGGKNLILCALLAQVVAYRYAHFGYVPQQSYLLFGALYLNLFIIYFSNLFFSYWYKNKQ